MDFKPSYIWGGDSKLRDLYYGATCLTLQEFERCGEIMFPKGKFPNQEITTYKEKSPCGWQYGATNTFIELRKTDAVVPKNCPKWKERDFRASRVLFSKVGEDKYSAYAISGFFYPYNLAEKEFWRPSYLLPQVKEWLTPTQKEGFANLDDLFETVANFRIKIMDQKCNVPKDWLVQFQRYIEQVRNHDKKAKATPAITTTRLKNAPGVQGQGNADAGLRCTS